jgi:hypothetical protein
LRRKCVKEAFPWLTGNPRRGTGNRSIKPLS